ncbi:CsbD family protein [Streptomyces sp. 12297]|uniref:CsbD family protein n=1 Tax=Streptomyces sp. NBC_00239 TaxID=2903640 RepID=UPI002E28DA80|nr:CsbD family protein [Streptomyces sp. NBC_00239]
MAGKGGMDKAKGKAKEAVGKATDDHRLTAEGKMDQAKGNAKQAMAEIDESLKRRKA